MTPTPSSADEQAIRALYRDLLRCWNAEDAQNFAALFLDDGSIIIYDGTLLNGRAEIEAQFRTIFARYNTPMFAQIVYQVRFLTGDMAILYGAVGMYSLPHLTINPLLNATQSLLAHRRDGAWRIAHFQNTRATFPGRPDLVEAMTAQLQAVADAQTGRR